MTKLFLIIVISLLAIFFLFPGVSGAISISATGGWSKIIGASDLVAGAGSDLKSSYESADGATLLSISGCLDESDTWKVMVSRIDSNWLFTLSVRKSGGEYQAITTTDSDFFTGAGDTANIALQYKLTGMSIKVSPGTYSTKITYTVVDT